MDNVESVLPNDSANKDPAEVEAYSQLFQHLAEGQHQSCVILTSRVKPKLIQLISTYNVAVQSLAIPGLQVADIQQIWSTKETFQGTDTEWNRLVNYYGGNPLIIGMVATTIQTLFNSRIADFLNQDTRIYENISTLLYEQFNVLSQPAKTVIKVLANQYLPISFLLLRSQVSHSISEKILFKTLDSLEARSLIKKKAVYFSLQPFIIDYFNL
ncbi:MAG: hypothetical protein SWJ54_06995 [Cyanobacteriota bacterium]|nr:hypothetical protein [Cyanobacteriota bacterium]